MVLTVGGSAGFNGGGFLLIILLFAAIFFVIILPEERGARKTKLTNSQDGAPVMHCVRFVKAIQLISRATECPSYAVFSSESAGDVYRIRITDGEIAPFPQDYTTLKDILTEEKKTRTRHLMNRFGTMEEVAQDADLSGSVVYQFYDQEGLIRFHSDALISSLKSRRKSHYVRALETMLREEIPEATAWKVCP